MIILNSVDDFIMREIHDNSFPLPDLTDRTYISCKTAVDNGQVTAVGLVKLTAEGILMTNSSLPLISRARGSAAIIEALKSDVRQQRLHECHAFVRNPNVEVFLKHLGFRDCLGGKALVINF